MKLVYHYSKSVSPENLKCLYFVFVQVFKRHFLSSMIISQIIIPSQSAIKISSMSILCQHILEVQCKTDIFFPHARKVHNMSPV